MLIHCVHDRSIWVSFGGFDKQEVLKWHLGHGGMGQKEKRRITLAFKWLLYNVFRQGKIMEFLNIFWLLNYALIITSLRNQTTMIIISINTKASLKEMSHDPRGSCYLHICWFCANSSLEQGLANNNPRAKSSMLPVFVHKVFVGTQPNPFVYILSVADFVLKMSELSNCDRGCRASQTEKYFLSGSLQKVCYPWSRRKKTELMGWVYKETLAQPHIKMTTNSCEFWHTIYSNQPRKPTCYQQQPASDATQRL